MNHLWIVSLVLTKNKWLGQDIANIVEVYSDISESEAIGNAVLSANRVYPGYALVMTGTLRHPAEPASTTSTPVNNP